MTVDEMKAELATLRAARLAALSGNQAQSLASDRESVAYAPVDGAARDRRIGWLEREIAKAEGRRVANGGGSLHVRG